MVTQALSYFAHQDFSSALQCLLDSKRHEAHWKTELLLDMDVSNSFSGLSTISFNHIIEVYGKECLKVHIYKERFDNKKSRIDFFFFDRF